MSPVAELASFELDGESFVRPDWAGRGLANIAPSILRLLAPSIEVELPSLAPGVLPAAMTHGVKTIVLVVADGLGHLQLEREVAAGNAPCLSELLKRAAAGDSQVAYGPLTSVFPTTTVAALGSINSGVAPSDHGLLAYSLYLEEFNTIAEMIRWGPAGRRGSFADPEFGVQPESFFWVDTIYARLQAAGVRRTFAVNPVHFAGTALTRMLHQHATSDGYVATSSLEPIVSRLVAEAEETTYIYAYWPTVDTIAHVIGPLTAEHSAEVAAFDLQLGRLLRNVARRDDTLLLMTADHGHVDTGPEFSVSLGEHPELMGMLRVPPAGERRGVYLHAKPGAAAEVSAYARERLRDVAPPLLREDAVELGLFGPGPLSDRAASRIGDVLLFPRRNLQLIAPVETPDGTPSQHKGTVFKGLHGGLTADEALVPLLAFRG
ncbi:MAG TPA: alkaline phosphatase family protein [Chloroflexota bacterium]|nr:alkaline phosphatase family protein [Chloroflexota bacterium]